jgi:solute carrier family 25 folate transporter 32
VRCVRLSALVSLLSGMSSGIVSTLILHPLDVAKTSLINPAVRSSGTLQLFRDIRGEAGIRGLWRGVGPAIARISLGSSLYFTTQTQLIEIIRARMHEQGQHT